MDCKKGIFFNRIGDIGDAIMGNKFRIDMCSNDFSNLCQGNKSNRIEKYHYTYYVVASSNNL